MHLNRLISVRLFLKNMLTIKIYLQISVYYVYPVNPFQADVTFLYSLRKPEVFILTFSGRIEMEHQLEMG